MEPISLPRLRALVYDYVSYCIVTISRLNATNPLFLIPGFISCFEEGSLEERVTTTDSNFDSDSDSSKKEVGGDPDLTIEKCTKTCRRKAYLFAGMQNGDECWCGDYAGKKDKEFPDMNPLSWTRNKNECNVPCSGDKSKFCGGKDLLALFDTNDHEPYGFLSTMVVNTRVGTKTAIGTTTSTGTGIVTRTAGFEEAPGASETRASSVSTRNMAVAWSLVLALSITVFA
ncbi:hypothetical protein QBC45DRAFT_57583 [Copromyces sp. CBS 386.78]|nr:hypothetical protein QBC45DRAFT_57583 [Copromyces sp. CBS 386.78]